MRGYLLGCRRPLRNQLHNFLQNFRLFASIANRYRRYNAASRKFISWIFLNGWREVPAAPRRTAHFHINLLPDARSVTGTRALIDTYLQYLREKGEKRVYGQMVSFATRRGEKNVSKVWLQAGLIEWRSPNTVSCIPNRFTSALW